MAVLLLSKERPVGEGSIVLEMLRLKPVIFICSEIAPASSSGSIARPLPLSSLGDVGDSLLFCLWISMLTLLGNETLFDPFELPLLSTCKLALADPCRLCLFSGSVSSGYDPPAAGPSRGEPMSGCDNGIAITPASSPCERFLFRVGTLGVEFVGFHSPRAALGRRGRDAVLLPPVPERLRKGEL